MRNHKPIISGAFVAAFVFCFTVFPCCTSKELNRNNNNNCDYNGTCCNCTATYNSTGTIAGGPTQVCSSQQEQAFRNTWTNPLITIECKR